jgi:sphinganine-1-phosphate aldolase
MSTLRELLNQRLKSTEPSVLFGYTVVGTLAAVAALRLAENGELLERSKLAIFRFGRKLLQPIIDKEIDKAASGLTFPSADGEHYFHEIPAEGLPSDLVVELSDRLHETLDKKMDNQLLSGVVYWGTVNHHNAFMKILNTHLWANPLFADYFGATRKMEAEVTTMTLSLFNGDPQTMAASYALGGTESVLLAMLAYRNQAISMGIERPEVICAATAHPAFDKAEEYFNIRLVKVPVDPVTKKIIVSEVEKAITSRTVAIVGSAPNFPFGVLDDIAGLSDVALRHNVGLHVDACLGGFIIQFMAAAGFEDIVVDFRVPGVTSISADIHKWGGAPKGASCVMFRSKELRRFHTFAFPDYPGGLYVTSGVSGSRPGYVTACAWAALLLNGQSGFVDGCRQVVSTTRYIAERITKIPGLTMLVPNAETTVIPFTSEVFDIYQLMKNCSKRGFLLNPLQFPCGVHLGVTMEHTKPGVADQFLAVIREEVELLLEATKVTGFNHKHDALIYGSTQGVPDRSIIMDVLRRYVDAYYRNEPYPHDDAH